MRRQIAREVDEILAADPGREIPVPASASPPRPSAGVSRRARAPKMRGKRLAWEHDRLSDRHIAVTRDRDRYVITCRGGAYSVLFMPLEAQHGSLESTMASSLHLGHFDSLGEAKFAAHEYHNGRGSRNPFAMR